VRRVQVDAKPEDGVPFQAHPRRIPALDRDEGQAFAADPLAIEVDIGAVVAWQYDVALAEFRNIDLLAAHAIRKECRVESDLLDTVGGHGTGSAQQ
jgi:hypothetical protein